MQPETSAEDLRRKARLEDEMSREEDEGCEGNV